jgi:hypothetical protein
VTASEKKKPLALCRSNNDCTKGTNLRATCFRHTNRRTVTNGICVDAEDECYDHSECDGPNQGGKCCNGYCCREEYFAEMKKLECKNDFGCQVSGCT